MYFVNEIHIIFQQSFRNKPHKDDLPSCTHDQVKILIRPTKEKEINKKKNKRKKLP